jgi:hypothetical protein
MADELKKYRNPIWQNKENRHIVCEMLQSDGQYLIAHIVAGPESEGGVNIDYDAVIAEYGLDDLDARTASHQEQREKNNVREKEQAEAQLMRQKQEVLFNMKLEAFEIDIVKNSENKELKKLIRKSKTPLEIQAYTTILIQKELDKDEQ